MNATALLLDLMNLGPMGLADVTLTSDGHYLGRHAGEAGYNVHIGQPKNAPGPGQDRSREMWEAWSPEQRQAVRQRAANPTDGQPIDLEPFGIEPDPQPATDQAAENRANGRTPAAWPALETLEAIHRELDGKEWNADTTDAIAQILAAAGYTFADPDDLDDDDEAEPLDAEQREALRLAIEAEADQAEPTMEQQLSRHLTEEEQAERRQPAKSVPFLGNDDDPEADQAERGEE